MKKSFSEVQKKSLKFNALKKRKNQKFQQELYIIIISFFVYLALLTPVKFSKW